MDVNGLDAKRLPFADEVPAILGGPASFPDGPPAWPVTNPKVAAAVAEAVANGTWGQYHGPRVAELESQLATFFEVPHALTCASGTLAVEAALRSVGVGPGDEVILAAYEYEPNFLSVHAIGAKPVLVDVAPHNWNLDPNQLANAVTPQTKAILCSHIHGGTVPIEGIMDWAAERGIAIVEDSAQSPAEQFLPAGRHGIFAAVRTLSFGGSKILSAGRGGAMLFADSRAFQRAKLWLSRGVQQWAPLSELQATVILPQLASVATDTQIRLAAYREIANCLQQLGSPVRFLPGGGLYKLGMQVDEQRLSLSRDLFVKAMRAEGVAFDAGFKALHIGRAPSRFRAVGELPHATAAHHGCAILHHPVLMGGSTAGQQVAKAIAKIYRNADRIRSAYPPG